MVELNFRIKEARKYAGLTQPELAEKIGVSHRTLTGYEKDASKITVRISQKIATICKVSEIWLLTGQGQMTGTDISNAKNLNGPNITKVVIEHQNIVRRFKDPERGLKINQKLIEIQDANEELYDQVESFIKGAHQAIKTMKSSSKKKGKDIGRQYSK